METIEKENIEYTGVFPFMSDIQIYNIAKENYLKTKDGPWQAYLDALIGERDDSLKEAQGMPTERSKEEDDMSRISESTRRALKEPRDSRYGISSYSLALAEEMARKSAGRGKLPTGFIYKNPYLLPDDVMAELMEKVAEDNKNKQTDLSDDFDENGLLKHDCEYLKAVRERAKERKRREDAGLEPLPEIDSYDIRWGNKPITMETQADKVRQQAFENKIEQLEISPVSKQKLMTFIMQLGKQEKPYSVEQFRKLGHNYLTAFLNPAIEAGIIIKNGSREQATYRVNY